MPTQSSQVRSNQHHLHPKLVSVVQRHFHHQDQSTVAEHNIQAYQTLTNELAAAPRPLVLDSFCGTGHSTAALAERHPEHLVVGIDKSAARLAKHPCSDSDNYLLLRADCEDIWRQLVADEILVTHHYMLYPNPWPKSGHLQRRVHGHASFPLLLCLGGYLELRSNWHIYVEEFAVAMQLAGQRGQVSKLATEATPLSLFERKYQGSGHTLWRFSAHIMP